MSASCSMCAWRISEEVHALKGHGRSTGVPCHKRRKIAEGFSPNTVHLTILMAFRMLIGGRGLMCRGRSGKLLILRLTPRGLRRLRLERTRSSRISSRTAL
jgi:hypothetical protein